MTSSNMFKKEQQQHQGFPTTSPLSPRISFSNDFVDTQQTYSHQCRYREAPVSSDFEFSLVNYSMMPADELFSKGKLLPCNAKTLRDELLVEDEFDLALPSRNPATGPARSRKPWLGLKKEKNLSKKAQANGDEGKDPETIQGLLREAE